MKIRMILTFVLLAAFTATASAQTASTITVTATSATAAATAVSSSAVLSVQPTPVAAVATTSLIVQVQPGANISALASQLGFTVTSTISSTTGAPTYVISGSGDPNALTQALNSTGAVNWVDTNQTVHVMPLDGGETVLPLDGGETVLPLDGGETVLPLGPGIPTVTTDTLQAALASVLQTLDGGETVLPLDGGETVLPLDQLAQAYAKVASLTVGSPGLILQPAFGKIGYYGAILNSTGKGISIADLDTGADTCHMALQGIMVYNFVASEPRAPEDCPVNGTVPGPGYGHGTAVASLLRILAPESTLWMLRVFDSTGTADVATVYNATVWAVNHGIKVINMSFGATNSSIALQDAISYASAHGVLVTGAAGNSGIDAIMYPAAISPALGTAATDLNDQKSSFSNYNVAVDISAPGSQLVAAYPGNRFAIVWGTSFASPMVAAEGALTAGAWGSKYNFSMSSSSLIRVIQSSADNIYPVNPLYLGKLGSGRINMWKAYSMVAPSTTTATTATAASSTSSTTTATSTSSTTATSAAASTTTTTTTTTATPSTTSTSSTTISIAPTATSTTTTTTGTPGP